MTKTACSNIVIKRTNMVTRGLFRSPLLQHLFFVHFNTLSHPLNMIIAWFHINSSSRHMYKNLHSIRVVVDFYVRSTSLWDVHLLTRGLYVMQPTHCAMSYLIKRLPPTTVCHCQSTSCPQYTTTHESHSASTCQSQ